MTEDIITKQGRTLMYICGGHLNDNTFRTSVHEIGSNTKQTDSSVIFSMETLQNNKLLEFIKVEDELSGIITHKGFNVNVNLTIIDKELNL